MNDRTRLQILDRQLGSLFQKGPEQVYYTYQKSRGYGRLYLLIKTDGEYVTLRQTYVNRHDGLGWIPSKNKKTKTMLKMSLRVNYQKVKFPLAT